ncbi:MAG TPA: hypothetical protein VLQ80_29920 [Candidatus Saccharimonadia bacterium]|nr:hypothetical protein [Candidatus Saccharimonadia bacterium]
MPRRRPRQYSLRYDHLSLRKETHFSRPWIAVGSFVLGLMTAAAALWVAVGTPTSLKRERLRQTQEVSRMANDIARHEVLVNTLQSEKQQYELDLARLSEHKQLVEEHNTLLSAQNSHLEQEGKALILSAVVEQVSRSLAMLQFDPTISIALQGEHAFQFGQRYEMHTPFTHASWQGILRLVRAVAREHGQGTPLQISHGDMVTLQRVIAEALQRVGQWNQTAKEYTQELQRHVEEYIQKKPDHFPIPSPNSEKGQKQDFGRILTY